MEKNYLLGFDCGTYEAKGLICDIQGKIKATASFPYVLKVPKPGFAEHDPVEDWWAGLKKVVKELLDKTNIRPDEIACIGISTVMAAVTALDENCNPLRNAILYGIDTRSRQQVAELNASIGEAKIAEISGEPCGIESFGPKIKWIRDNEPEIFVKAKHFTIASGFLNAKLTGRYAVDRYSAMRAQPMIDVRNMTWNDEMCSYVCPKELLPDIVMTTDIIGTVTKAAAAETGLAEGTPVIAGTTDAAAEAISVGVVDPGDTMFMYGSTWFMQRITETWLRDDLQWTGVFVLKDRFTVKSAMATTGSLTRWIRDQFAKDLVEKEEKLNQNAYEALFKEAEGIPAGSGGIIVLPYFLGERMPIQDPQARGVIFGLNLTHTRGHIVKAVFEGIGYGIDQNLSLLKEAGLTFDSVTSVGGGTKSRCWMQTVSDVCGIRQVVPEVTIGACYGDALLAGLGIGAFKTPSELKKLIKVKYIIEPDSNNHVTYAPLKKHYAEIYNRTKDIMHALC